MLRYAFRVATTGSPGPVHLQLQGNDVDLAQVATDMGALGIRVDKPGDLRPSVERALAAGRPALIDVRTDINVTAPPAVA
jgi:thiamine pyrophosphate-dependent acetolactate synthase large subunit-like protein